MRGGAVMEGGGGCDGMGGVMERGGCDGMGGGA